MCNNKSMINLLSRDRNGAKISCCDLGKKKEKKEEKEERKKGKRERGRARVPSECLTVSTEPRR